jgi:uncharacterized membrane protein
VTPERKALLQIHFCVLLWGFTAILGKLISLPALELVWWRMLIVVAVLLAWPPLWRELRTIPPRTLAAFAGIGVVVALHWLTFYGSIKVSTASIGASCMATSTMFTALMEPIWFKRRVRTYEVVLGVLVIGATVAEAFTRLYYFERAAETYIRALQTGRKLRVLSDAVAESVAHEMEVYPEMADRHLAELKAILDEEEPAYRQ